MLPPDSDHIKKIGEDEEPDEKDVVVEFEGVAEYLCGPLPHRVAIGRVNNKEKKQVLFWQLTGGDSHTTADMDLANIKFAKIAVDISLDGQLLGEFGREEEGIRLNYNAKPCGEVKVIFPVIVNHLPIDAKTPLLMYKLPPPKSDENKKRKVTAVPAIDAWKKTGCQGRGRERTSSGQEGKRISVD